MTRLFFIAFAFVALVPGGAFAQGTAGQSGTTQQRKACNADARRFCKNAFKDGDFAIYSCLQTNAAKLRPACRKVVFGY
jgi:hypothetical protein